MAERGVEVDASCICRWVQVYSPELNKRCRSHLKPADKSYRIDETDIKVKGADKYLYRAVDSTWQTIDFLLTAKRETAAAKRFSRNAIDPSGNGIPRVMNVDPDGIGRGAGNERRSRVLRLCSFACLPPTPNRPRADNRLGQSLRRCCARLHIYRRRDYLRHRRQVDLIAACLIPDSGRYDLVSRARAIRQRCGQQEVDAAFKRLDRNVQNLDLHGDPA
jgi:hypothetical protein